MTTNEIMPDETKHEPEPCRQEQAEALNKAAEPGPECSPTESGGTTEVANTEDHAEDEQVSKEKADAEATVERLYKEGKPFWTKDLFRDIETQMANNDPNQIYYLTWKGIDGRDCFVRENFVGEANLYVLTFTLAYF
jgi:hypothetical protein